MNYDNGARRGLVFSVVSSVFFAGIYFVTPLLAPASAQGIWAIRNILTLPIILLGVAAFRQPQLIAQVWRDFRAKPWLVPIFIVNGALIAAQLWVFSWAPLNGRGLQVALGYFLLPLVLVVIGRFLYKDKLLWWQWLAAAVAALGVIYEISRVGSISWETLLVMVGYPVYFVLKRLISQTHLGSMFWEFAFFSPLAVVFLWLEVRGGVLGENMALLWVGPLFGLWTGVALLCYLVASRLLNISLFGLLSYLEPALLVVASLLIGERITAGELPIYAAVWLAVIIIMLGGVGRLLQSARRRRRR